MLELLRDFWGFAHEHRKLWLIPLVAMLVFLSALIAAAQYSTFAPFIYTLF